MWCLTDDFFKLSHIKRFGFNGRLYLLVLCTDFLSVISGAVIGPAPFILHIKGGNNVTQAVMV